MPNIGDRTEEEPAMSEETVVEAGAAAQVAEDTPDEDEALLEDLLVEEVSIDGMCGVY
jgi:mycofactocin precursor